MKKIILILSLTYLFANSYNYAKNILGETYKKYENVIKSSLEKNASLKDTLIFLKNNGFIDTYFKHIKAIHPTFIFINNNPVFNTKTLYDSLKELGYYNFYPIKITKNSIYAITLELQSQNYIDPLNFLNAITKRGCTISNIKKDKNFTYYIDCYNEKLINATKLKDKTQVLHNINGIYYIDPNNFKKIYISTSKYDFWHPYIAFYNKNLEIINIISSSNRQRKKILTIPKNCKYIKIMDYFTKDNIKRGIFIKGLK